MGKTITENYVSYEIALLLKEKGFDEPCRSAYLWDGEKEELCTVFSNYIQFNSEDCEDGDMPRISAPTHQMAMKWLRGKGIIITITYKRYSMHILGSQMMFGFNIQNVQGDLLAENTEVAYDSYEQSEMDAIKYCLINLIE